ncbi:hypothetical protein ABWH97_07660 [Nitratireductor sp. ac15]
MSSQNNEINFAVMGLAAIGFAALAFFYVVAAIAAFLALIFTVLSLIAWNKPLKISRWIYTPHEARWFVYRGLIGTFMLPFFAGFCSILFDLTIPHEWWGYIYLAGYVLGSVGIAMMFDLGPQEEAHPSLPTAVEPPKKYMELPASRPDPKPFEYASWDDEQEMK